MKLNKWITLGAVLGCSVFGVAQTQDVRVLDIVIRDFQPNHPDFENFSEESVQHQNDILNYTSPLSGIPMSLYGYDAVWSASTPYHITCGNKETFDTYHSGAQIAIDGKPRQSNPMLPAYLKDDISTLDVLMYGECSGTDPNMPGKTQRGYTNSQSGVSGYKCPNGSAWENPVIYTPGMVQPFLKFRPSADGTYDMLDSVDILKLNDLCDNMNFAQWYTDVPGVNKRVNATMDIPKDTKSKYYIYDYNYNNGGYSPLDSINPLTREWVSVKPCNPAIQKDKVCDQFGPQSLSIFCPPYGYEYAKTQRDFQYMSTDSLCMDWLSYGGPRAVSYNGTGNSAAVLAALNYSTVHPNPAITTDRGQQFYYEPTIGKTHLRNYAFTMMGYASFKYRASNQVNSQGLPDPEVFEFAGDDDMWIFVDGVLVVDLGGTHLSAPGKVDISVLAKNNHGCHVGEPLAAYTNCKNSSDATGWADDTWHYLHFFYADRQSDGSNIFIRTSLAELAPSRYGQPSVSDVTVKVDENGVAHNSMYMNVPLADSSLIAINNPNVPSMVVLRDVTDENGVTRTAVYGFFVTSMTGPYDKGADGQMYQFEGKVMTFDANGSLVEVPGGLLGGDRIAFNVPYSKGLDDDGNGGNYTSEEWQQLMIWSKLVPFYVASVSGKHVEGFDERDKWGKISYTAVAVVAVIPDDPAYDRPDFTSQAQTLTDIAENNGGELPTDMTADLVLAPIPPVANEDPVKWAKKNVDMLNSSGAKQLGDAVVYGANQGTNSTLCYNDGSTKVTGKKSNESCAEWSFPTTQPFQVNIRVFDHLGHFVNQYNKRVTGDDFKKALAGQSSSYSRVDSIKAQDCKNTAFGADDSKSTGALLATIKMYPVTNKGRLLATGPYIYQMTIVMEQFDYCYKKDGYHWTDMTMPFLRTTETIRRGYRRTKKK